MDDRRSKAEAWVNGYTGAAVAAVLAVAIVPGAATAVLCRWKQQCAIKLAKCMSTTGQWEKPQAGVVGLASLFGHIAAMEAAILTGPFAFAIKPAIAAGVLKSMGTLVIKHFEDASN